LFPVRSRNGHSLQFGRTVATIDQRADTGGMSVQARHENANAGSSKGLRRYGAAMFAGIQSCGDHVGLAQQQRDLVLQRTLFAHFEDQEHIPVSIGRVAPMTAVA
jgi:hypothetical protein